HYRAHDRSYFFVYTWLHPLGPTLFPYTTLFRSRGIDCSSTTHSGRRRRLGVGGSQAFHRGFGTVLRSRCRPEKSSPGRHSRNSRSEEHTSELQSQSNLVCRLLLEKKKTKRSLVH